MRKDDLVRLRHMLDAAREAVSFAKNQTRDTFENNRMLLLSIVRSIEVIGEAAAQVTREGREKYPEIPWPEMVAMRNRLIHAYFDVDADRVWDSVKDDLPSLIAKLEKILTPNE